nr:hypothetical protein [Tanacetum cinerariifolium]
MRELVMKYKAEKACYEEMVKMPLVDLKVLEDESFRMCIDYRELSKIDLYSGCHQIRVHEDEIPRIAFRMSYGYFELTVMPFGLTNAPAAYTKSKEEHESHLKMNLELLKKEKCHVKPNNVEAESSGSFLEIIGTIWERANIVVDAWSRKGGVKSRRVRDICRTIQAKVSKKMLVVYVETSKAEDVSIEMLRGLDQLVERKEDGVARHGVHVSSILDTDGMYIEVLERDVEVVRNASSYEACVRNLVVVEILTFREAEIKESKMIGFELEQETTKVFVIKERLKEAKDHQEIKT